MKSEQLAEHLLRCCLALLIFIHGAHRIYDHGVADFGSFLEAQSFPFGPALAWAITVYELVGPLLLLARRWVAPIAVTSAIQYGTGIWLVHWQHGWFVVGGGFNGMEYSLLLIAGLLTLALLQPRRAG
ncbi:DoxX family protein [Permianibacter sp. IMCC34836]|uniref:DoxX family protein n=1 Tax=Permianibacter fluminis TaxID=2738515 RepID=UPI001557FB0A|nr:DoxX family protein [Permianibacter fluminis]NQD36384.1 DoxX family protein [Permianibacter fluminis]